MRGDKIRIERPGSRMSPGKIFLVLALLVMPVTCCNCVCCPSLFPPPDTQWYNYSFDPASNVTIGVLINITAPDTVTILDTDSDMASVSMHTNPRPQLYLRSDAGWQGVDVRLQNLFEDEPGTKVETIISLPHGPEYTVMIANYGPNRSSTTVVNHYTGGNLTLLVSDPDPRMPDHLVALMPMSQLW